MKNFKITLSEDQITLLLTSIAIANENTQKISCELNLTYLLNRFNGSDEDYTEQRNILASDISNYLEMQIMLNEILKTEN